MHKGLFRYNPKTCRYEPAPFPIWNVLGWFTFFLLSSGFFFFLFAHLQSLLFPTSSMQRLQEQNRVYAHHIIKMKNELISLNQLLTGSEQREEDLVRKLFGESNTVKTKKTVTAYSDSDNPHKVIQHLTKKIDGILTATRQGEVIYLRSGSYKTSWPMSWPVDGAKPVVASGFGERIHPYHKGKYFHAGIDIPAARGTEVKAAGAGKVSRVLRNSLESGYGNYVEITHDTGLVSRYACLHDIVVRVGQGINEGQVIGYVGASGSAVAPHVHFEVLINNRPVNPMLFLVKGFSAREYARLMEESNSLNQSLD
ncbi:MAG: M23 family metallopeptidase [Cyclobacteriaceae bacterium]|nr:M23 family metallopeptidase [Cyclobacteriaceae bacterium]